MYEKSKWLGKVVKRRTCFDAGNSSRKQATKKHGLNVASQPNFVLYHLLDC